MQPRTWWFICVAACVAAGTVGYVVRKPAQDGDAPSERPYGPGARLLSEDVKEREDSLNELNHAIRTGQDVALEDLDVLFVGLAGMESTGYVYRAVHILALLPADAKVVARARAALDSDSDAEQVEIVAALAYLEAHDRERFEAFFAGGSPLSRDPHLLDLFHHADPVRKMREQVRDEGFRVALSKFLGWSGSPAENPHRDALAQAPGSGPRLVAAFTSAASGSTEKAKIAAVIGQLGLRDAFDVLLGEYWESPEPVLAVASGACMGSLSLEKILEQPDAERRSALLKEILNGEWDSAKDLDLAGMRKFLLENLLEIKGGGMQRCRAL